MVKTIPGKKVIITPGFLLILCLWLIVQGVLFHHFGIVTKGEATKYIAEAGYWELNHHFSQPKYLFYSFYIAIHVFFNQTGLGSTGVYVFQLVLSLGSLFFFYKMTNLLFDNNKAALIAGILLTVCIPWQSWTTHLYTESVFISLVIIFTYFFLKPNKTLAEYFFTAILLLLLLFTRPTGMLFIPLGLIWFIMKWIREQKWISLTITLLVTLSSFILLANYAMKGQGEFDFLKPFVEEHIICGVPQSVNNNLILPADGNSVQGLSYYIIHNPWHFLKLSFQKLGAFLGITRSYYSSMHNLGLSLFFYPLYAFALIGLINWIKYKREILLFLVGGIGIFALSVTLTCDDWLNRFIMPVVPYIILLATAGITSTTNYLAKKINRGAV